VADFTGFHDPPCGDTGRAMQFDDFVEMALHDAYALGYFVCGDVEQEQGLVVPDVPCASAVFFYQRRVENYVHAVIHLKF